MKISYDLHIHSCLSPCGDIDMTPNNIVNMASIIGLDCIAVTDHNTAGNILPVAQLCKKANITFISGIEINTAEEVHILTLFDNIDAALQFDSIIYDSLPNIKNNPEFFGQQIYMDSADNITGYEDKLLINALSLGIEQIIPIVNELDGICIPAHIDKTSYSIISSLGFIPTEYDFSCIEVKNPNAKFDFPFKIIHNSDAHYLEHINEPINFLEVDNNDAVSVLRCLKQKLI